jgi:ATP-binding cassette subfamily B protein
MSASESATMKKGSSLLRVLAFLGKYPGEVALSVGLLLASISIEMSLPQILGSAITNLRWHMEFGASFSIRNFLLLYVSLVLVRAGVGYLLGPIRNRLVQRVLTDIRARIYDALQRLPFRYHDKANTGELISRSTTDVWRLQDFFYACLFLSVDIGVSLIVTVTLIFLINPTLGFATLATMAPTAALLAYYSRQLQPQWRKVHDLHGAMTTVVQENIAGVRVVKAFGKEAAEIGKFEERRQAFLKTVTEAVNYWAARVPFTQFVYGLGLPLVLWLGGRKVIANQLLIGDLVKVVFYLMAIGHRMVAIGQFTNILQTASASGERVLEIIHEPQTLRNGNSDYPAGGNGEVVFDQVSFEYKPEIPSVKQVSFTAHGGEVCAIVGATGAGKSTLMHLIPRYYDPTAGRVLIDGVDIRALRLSELRRHIAVIFQETFLFSASVAENIAFGRPDASREEIERCARAAQAHEFISELASGYDTMIGERGVTLSGGQKQRLAIARAFVTDPRIIIMDDATASVDSRTERLIQEALRELYKGRTTFIIAHRLSTVQHAHQIIVLDQGRVVQQGRHSELASRKGIYRSLFGMEDTLETASH